MLSLFTAFTLALSVANASPVPVSVHNNEARGRLKGLGGLGSGLPILSGSGAGSLAGSGTGALGVGGILGVVGSGSGVIAGAGSGALAVPTVGGAGGILGGFSHGVVASGTSIDLTGGLFGAGIFSTGGSRGWYRFNCPSTWVARTWYQFGYYNNFGLWVAFRTEALLIAHLQSLRFNRIQIENASQLFLGLDVALTARATSTFHANQFGYWTSAVGGIFVALDASLDVKVVGDVDLLLGSCEWGRNY